MHGLGWVELVLFGEVSVLLNLGMESRRNFLSNACNISFRPHSYRVEVEERRQRRKRNQ